MIPNPEQDSDDMFIGMWDLHYANNADMIDSYSFALDMLVFYALNSGYLAFCDGKSCDVDDN